MTLSRVNTPAAPTHPSSIPEPVAGSGTQRRALERFLTSGPLQPRSGGSPTGAGAGAAPRQSFQALNLEGRAAADAPTHAAYAAGGAVLPPDHVIDIDRAGVQPAGAAQAPVPRRRVRRDALFVGGAVTAVVAMRSYLDSYSAVDSDEQQGLVRTAIGCASVSSVAFGTWLGMRWRASRSNVPEAPGPLALRRPDLRGHALSSVVARFGIKPSEPEPAATQCDWSAPALFVDSSGANQTGEVSHMLMRALEECSASNKAFRNRVGIFLNQLAASPALRADLADQVVEVNGQCGDRIGIRLGELLLTQALREVRDPAAAPRDVVLTLVLHAATQAMKKQMAARLGRDAVPSADLLLAGFHAMQSTLRQQGIAVPAMFPAEDDWDEADLLAQRLTIRQDAAEIAQCYGLQVAEGAGSSGAGAVQGADRGIGLATLVRHHGGRAYDDILASRLAHLRDPVLAHWHERDAVGADAKGYEQALDNAYGQAIAGALGGDLTAWVRPAASLGQAGGKDPTSS